MFNFERFKKKGQISFEYIVLIGGIIVFTVIVLTVVRNVLNQNTSNISNTRSVILNKTCNPTSDIDPISLVAYYRFDEVTGNFARDSSKNSYDLTGSNNVYGGAGVVGGSLMGANTANSSVSQKIFFSGPFTIEFYLKVTDLTANLSLFLGNNVFMNYSVGNVTLYQVNDNAVNYTFNVSTSSTFTYNNWNHIAVTYNNNSYSSYVNLNYLAGNTTAVAQPASDIGFASMLGLNISASKNYSIFLDELKIYNRALSLSEISNDAACIK